MLGVRQFLLQSVLLSLLSKVVSKALFATSSSALISTVFTCYDNYVQKQEKS